MKKCKSCKVLKNYSEFHLDKKSKDGLKTECKECRNSEKKKYRNKNRETILKKDKKYRIENRDTIRLKSRIYYQNNKEIYRIKSFNYRAKRSGANGKITKNVIKEILEFQDYKCLYCNCNITKKHHIDHIIPLSKNGDNTRDNLCATCPTCNLKKSNNLFWNFVLSNHDEYYENLKYE